MSSLTARKALLAAAGTFALALTAAPAAAQTYNFADFGNSVFSYGYGTAGTSFTAYPNVYGGGCFGVATFACATAGDSSALPTIGVNTGSSTLAFQTVNLPTNTLLFHPGSAGTGSDSILIFTAPVAGQYAISGSFSRLDNTPTGGNGVLVSAYVNNLFNSAAILPNGPQYSSIPLGGTLTLAAGQTLLLSVGNNGEYTYDSTGLSGSIRAVPEPATWAMMIAGLGAIGVTMRRRKTVSGAAVA